MTEQEWLECTDPGAMLGVVQETASGRKLRLFTVACARLVWSQVTNATFRNTVEVAERYADGLAPESELEEASLYSFFRAPRGLRSLSELLGATDNETVFGLFGLFNCTTFSLQGMRRLNWRAQWSQGARLTGRQQPALLRDIFGNPFRAVTVSPSWLTSTVVSVASAMYEERDFCMPGLGDALEDAGCNSQAILMHCRSGGEHVRGCFVVDWVLGKQ